MRLLNARELSFKQFHQEPPPYAILSHRWGESEPSLVDIAQQRGSPKVHGFADYVKSHLPQLEWLWMDSCCIKQDSSLEVSEAVNCMFDWYRNSSVCIAYLPDVGHASDQGAFLNSVWFKRGWTLQELVASTVVLFVANNWQIIGHKGNACHLQNTLEVGPNLELVISEVTSIQRDVLGDFSNSHTPNIEQVEGWMVGRETLKEEDMFYALFGIFGVTPGSNYGEKRAGAKRRLCDAIAQKQGGSVDLTAARRSNRHSIPFRRDEAFVNREEMITIGRKLSQPQARVVIVGLGGIGKSQLAIEQCHRIMDGISNKSIMWLHASSAARFDQEVTMLAHDMDIPGCQGNDSDIYRHLRSWLNDPDRPWLIVMDNLDDASFLSEAPESIRDKTSRAVRMDYFPACKHGSILVTTRRKDVARSLADEQDITFLEPERKMAVEVLRSKLDIPQVTSSVTKLADALDHIPLALAQAAAYIIRNSPLCTIDDYLAKIDQSDKTKSDLMKAQSSELRRDRREAENSILLTWQISFEHIRRIRQSAAELLSEMSFYNHQSIPDILFRKKLIVEKDLTIERDQDKASGRDSDNDIDDTLKEDITVLRDYSFISVVRDGSIVRNGSALRMHRLVQLWAQVWLQESSDQYEQYQARSIERLDNAFPGASYDHWTQCHILQPHAERLCNSKVKDDSSLLALASVGFKAAWFAQSQGLFAEAEKMIVRSVYDRQRILGAEHSDTLTSMSDLALSHRDQGRFDEAEKLGVSVLETRKKNFGEEHFDTLASMSNLALTYSKQGRIADAERLNKMAYDGRMRLLGPEHSRTLISANNLAATYRDQERWQEAEKLAIPTFEIRKRIDGEEHPYTLMTMKDLALTYSRQRHRLLEAEELGVKVVELRTKVLGRDHPDTLMSMHNLAATYLAQERLPEAWELAQECYQSRIKVLGETHPDTLKSAEQLESIVERSRRMDVDD